MSEQKMPFRGVLHWAGMALFPVVLLLAGDNLGKWSWGECYGISEGAAAGDVLQQVLLKET